MPAAGGVTKDAASGNITAVKSLLLTYYMQGEKRDSLSFRFWNIFGNIPDRSDTEKWEQAFLEFGEANEQFQGPYCPAPYTRGGVLLLLNIQGEGCFSLLNIQGEGCFTF